MKNIIKAIYNHVKVMGRNFCHGLYEPNLVHVGSRVKELMAANSDDLRSIFFTFFRFDLRRHFDLDLTSP